MAKLGYDNYEDAKAKLAGTYCMYRGKAVVVKVVAGNGENLGTQFKVLCNDMSTGKPLDYYIDIDDPEFDAVNFNLGYVNYGKATSWFYRIPTKQWQQGLKPTQMGSKCSNRDWYGYDFKGGKQIAQMLQNEYPKFQEATVILKTGSALVMAFHRNFAVSMDTIHDDFIIEYKGENIGFTHDLETFKLMSEFEHLHEALKEATS